MNGVSTLPDARPDDARASRDGPRGSRERTSNRRAVALALAGSFALVAVVVAIVLSGSPMVVAAANSTPVKGVLAVTASSAGACQAGETLPAGTSAVRLTLESEIGPRVSVAALSGRRVLTRGAAPSGWTSGSVTVPVEPLARTASPVRICFQLGPTRESVALVGSRTNAAVAATSLGGGALPGRIKVEYMRRARASWWSLIPSLARRMGLGRQPGGGWIALVAIGLIGLAVAGGSWLAWRELR